jgi:hypothetical protein
MVVVFSCSLRVCGFPHGVFDEKETSYPSLNPRLFNFKLAALPAKVGAFGNFPNPIP